MRHIHVITLVKLGLVLLILTGCGKATQPTADESPSVLPHTHTSATAASTPIPSPTWPADRALSEDEVATLNSLAQIDDYPLYTMRYVGAYFRAPSTADIRPPETVKLANHPFSQASWGCSLFAALGDSDNQLYGRNFDWRFSPALLLFTDPPDDEGGLPSYASVSMVDIDYLGFGGDRAKSLADLTPTERHALLHAPFLPFDGMNERGLAVGMAAVPPGEMRSDPQKKTIDQLMAIREILDHAGTVDEAVDILGRYNIDMGGVPIHYLIASASGNSALVEFYQSKMQVFRNESSWQVATNFLFASTGGRAEGQCWRYDLISQRMKKAKGRLSVQDALGLLADVSQDNTQWSIVYDMTSGDVNIIMGRDYADQVHTLQLRQTNIQLH